MDNLSKDDCSSLKTSNHQANSMATKAGDNDSTTNISLTNKGSIRYYKPSRMSRFRSFWECTKPCGILTLVFGIVLVSLSILGFILLFDNNLCQSLETCQNGLIQIGSVSNLVIGVVVTLIGIVIIIYSKKDSKTKVIIATGKRFEHLSLVDNQRSDGILGQ